jgi:hypothetical protein
MKAKEIHDLLLSLLIRGLGFWMLYGLLPNYYDVLGHLHDWFYPSKVETGSVVDMAASIFYLVMNSLPAIYFILGAPPLLKWATRKKE